MNYPDNTIPNATYWDARAVLAEKRRELEAEADDDDTDVSTTDALMELLGITGGTIFLWDGQPFEVTDDANFGHYLKIEDLNASKARDPYVTQDLEDPEMLVKDRLQGDVQPAKQTVVEVEQTEDNTASVPEPDAEFLPDEENKESALAE